MANIVAVFQTWYNGGLCTSGLITSAQYGQDYVDHFLEQSKQSFASTYVFYDVEEANREFSKVLKRMER